MYKTKQLISLILVLAMCLSLGTTAFAIEINTAGSSAETPVILNVEAALFSVTIPTGLPVDVAANGTVTVATDAKIINNSHGPVQVVNMTIEAVDSWEIADYEIDLRNEKVDSNKISMIINECATTGANAIAFNADNFTVMLAKSDDTTDECPIVYNAKVTPLSEVFATDTVANLVFTVDWYKAEGSATETTTSIPVVATDSDGNTLNATSTDIVGTEKDDLLAKLEESGLVASADAVDALIEVESDDFDNFANATFDVSEIAQEGDKVVILHFDETTQQWEYITEATVDAEGKISADFSSFSPVAFVVVKEDGSLGDIEYVNGIAISGTTSCEVGGTSTLTATVNPETATNPEVIWSSNNENVAKVDASTGTVTGVSAGTAIITATAADGNGASNSVEFTVTEPGVSGVLAIYSADDSSLRFYDTGDTVVKSGDSYNGMSVTAVYTDFDTTTYTKSSNVPWNEYATSISNVIIEDEGIAPVSTAYWFYNVSNCSDMNLSKLDTSNVTNMNSMFYNCKSLTELDLSSFNTSNVADMALMFRGSAALTTIYVSDLWSISSVGSSDLMFYNCKALVGGNSGLTYEASKSNATYANYVTGYLTFKEESSGSGSGDGSVVFVNEIAISGTTSCEVGSTSTLTATVDPETATNTEVIWSSNNESIAKVDAATGVVTGIAAGTATITATAADGNGASASVEFTVNEPVVSVNEIAINGTASCEVGGTSTLTATILPANATNTEVIWSSNNEGVAKVDASTGVVTGIAAGTATITATAADGNGASASVEFTVTAVPVTGVLAIYSETDNSLRFYNTTDQVVKGETYNNLAVTDIYTGFNTAKYDYHDTPWSEQASTIESVVFEDTISPNYTAYWFCDFEACTSMDLEKLNTWSVMKMDHMFAYCSSLTTLDLSSFVNSYALESFTLMFAGCSNLTTIYVSEWSPCEYGGLPGSAGSQMFNGCNKLVGAIPYSSAGGTDGNAANYETGYFTYKAAE